jgi:hypothetical protein
MRIEVVQIITQPVHHKDVPAGIGCVHRVVTAGPDGQPVQVGGLSAMEEITSSGGEMVAAEGAGAQGTSALDKAYAEVQRCSVELQGAVLDYLHVRFGIQPDGAAPAQKGKARESGALPEGVRAMRGIDLDIDDLLRETQNLPLSGPRG